MVEIQFQVRLLFLVFRNLQISKTSEMVIWREYSANFNVFSYPTYCSISFLFLKLSSKRRTNHRLPTTLPHSSSVESVDCGDYLLSIRWPSSSFASQFNNKRSNQQQRTKCINLFIHMYRGNVPGRMLRWFSRRTWFNLHNRNKIATVTIKIT